MNKAKISIICLSVLLIILVAICVVIYRSSNKDDTVVKDGGFIKNEELVEDEQTSLEEEEDLVSEDFVSVLDQVQRDTNDPLSPDEWVQVIDELNGAFVVDDFEYLGYLEDTDNLFFYKLKDSDIVMTVSTDDNSASIEHFDNSVSEDYAIVYFSMGMPENKEEIYKLDFDYNFYVTNYQGGDTVQYWLLNDPDEIMEIKIK